MRITTAFEEKREALALLEGIPDRPSRELGVGWWGWGVRALCKEEKGLAASWQPAQKGPAGTMGMGSVSLWGVGCRLWEIFLTCISFL